MIIKYWIKSIVLVLLVSLLLLISFAAIAPTIISTEWGQKQLLALVNSRIPGTITAKEIDIHWFGPQTIKNIELKDTKNEPIATITAFTTQASLFDLMWKKIYGHSKIEGLNLNLIEYPNGETNLHQTLGLGFTQRVKDTPSDPMIIQMSNIEANLTIPRNQEPVIAFIKGKTKQENIAGSFMVDLNLMGLSEKAWRQLQENPELWLQHDSTEGIHLKAEIENFPVSLIDHIVSLKKPELRGISKAALGEILNISIHNAVSKGTMAISLRAKSPTFLAAFNGNVTPDHIELAQPGTVEMMITPHLIQLLSNWQKSNHHFALMQPVNAVCTIEQLKMPFSFLQNSPLKNHQSEEISLVTSISLPHAELTNDLLGPISLRQVLATIHAPNTAKTIIFKFQGEAVQHGTPMQIKLGATLDKPSHLNTLIDSIKRQIGIKMEITEAPMALIDQAMGLDHALAQLFGAKASLQADIVSLEDKAHVQAFIAGDLLSIQNIQLDMIQEPTKSIHCALIADIYPIANHLLAAILGGPIHLKAKGSFKDQFAIDPFQLEFKSILAEAKFTGRLDNHKRLSLTTPSEIAYVISQSFLDYSGLFMDRSLALDRPTTLHLNIDPLTIQLDDHLLSTLQLSGRVLIDELAMKAYDEDILIRHFDLPWKIDALANNVEMEIKSDTRHGKLASSIRIANWLKNDNLDWQGADVAAAIKLIQVPVSLLESITGNKDLVSLVGSLVDISLDANMNMGKWHVGQVDIALQGDQIKADMALNIGDAISLKENNRPLLLTATLTPKRFSILRSMLQQSEDTLSLLEPTDINLTVHSLHIPWRNASSAQPYQLAADLMIDKLNVSNASMQSLFLENITAHFDSQDLTKKLAFHMKGKERLINSHPLQMQGTIEHFLTPSGSVDFDNLSLNLEVKTRRLPAGLFCQMGCLESTIQDKIEALLGETVDTDIKVHLHHMNGPLMAQLNGKNGHVLFDGQLTNGVLTLNKPFEIQVAVTPQLGKSILQDFIPILSGVIAADAPIKISIDPVGFSLPLKQIDINKITIGLGTIDLGKMTFNNEGQLGTIFDLLKPSSQEDLSVWFTPLYIDLQAGLLRLGRMDMLMLNRYPMALWGKVDIIKDKVDLRIGLTGTALSQALNLKNLDKSYMMQLPLKGNMGHAGIDKTKAAARISALVAQNQGGAHGLIIGTFLDIAGGSLSEDKVPPSTTSPLPWEENQTSSETPKQSDTEGEAYSKKKKRSSERDSGKDDLGKQLGGMAGSLLQNLMHDN